MRLSTAITPRIITCADDLEQYISLPRGCACAAEQLLDEHRVALAIEDGRHLSAPLDLKFNGELTVVQSAAARKLLEHDTGVFVAPPGIGKTVLGTYLVPQRASSTLMLFHRKPLLEQWVALANDEVRNTAVINDVIAAVEEGRSPILLTERRDHLEYFADRLRGFVRHLIVLQGGMTTKARHRSVNQLASIPDTTERLVLATGRYIGEGFDDARLDTLFLAMPVSWKGTRLQEMLVGIHL